MELYGRTELVHRFAVEADEEREGVAALFDADTPGYDRNERVGAGSSGQTATAHAVLHISDANILLGAVGEMDHAGSVEGDDALLGVVVEALAD